MLNQSHIIASLQGKGGHAWFQVTSATLWTKVIQIHIQISMGHNHPELWDQLRETTNSQPITQFKPN
jgi:hypothetical protein